MTRLQSAARDYAIAALSRSSESDVCRLASIDAATLLSDIAPSRAHYDIADALSDRSFDPSTPYRILRARVALYLRLMRRVEVWDRAEIDNAEYLDREASYELHTGPVYCPHEHAGSNDWSFPPMIIGPPPIDGGEAAWHAHIPWRPLWLDAPPHDPTITPKMRRERVQP